jgi:hypothetical protein
MPRDYENETVEVSLRIVAYIYRGKGHDMKVGENAVGAFAGIINSTTEFYLEQGFLDIGDHKGK